MNRSASFVVASLVLALLVLGGIGSCKQGEGERCQVEADCEEGLVCNQGEGLCRETLRDQIVDDAPTMTIFDAAPDAPGDAPDAP